MSFRTQWRHRGDTMSTRWGDNKTEKERDTEREIETETDTQTETETESRWSLLLSSLPFSSVGYLSST